MYVYVNKIQGVTLSFCSWLFGPPRQVLLANFGGATQKTARRRANRDPTSRAASPRRFEDGRAGSGSNHRAADLARGTRAAPLRPAPSRAVTQRVTCSPLARASTRLERRLLWPSAGGGWRGVAFRGYPRPAMQPCVFARACDAESTSSASEPPTRPNPLRSCRPSP